MTQRQLARGAEATPAQATPAPRPAAPVRLARPLDPDVARFIDALARSTARADADRLARRRTAP